MDLSNRMRILITGGAGCLGSNLIEHWLSQGHAIFVIDNFATGKPEVVPQLKGLCVQEGSIADQALVNDCFDRFKPDAPVVPAAIDDVPVVALDVSETFRAFGWKARLGFSETIRRQLAWYDAHGVTDVFSHLKSSLACEAR